MDWSLKLWHFQINEKNVIFDYKLENNILSRVKFFTVLGVTFDLKISFNLYIDTIITEATKDTGVFWEVQKI